VVSSSAPSSTPYRRPDLPRPPVSRVVASFRLDMQPTI